MRTLIILQFLLNIVRVIKVRQMRCMIQKIKIPTFYVKNLKGSEHLENLDTDGGIVLKWIKQGVKVWDGVS